MNNAENEDDIVVRSLAVSHDGKTVVTGSKNNHVKLYKADTLEFIITLARLTSPVTHVAISANDSIM